MHFNGGFKSSYVQKKFKNTGPNKFGVQVQLLEQCKCALTDGCRRDNTVYRKVNYTGCIKKK